MLNWNQEGIQWNRKDEMVVKFVQREVDVMTERLFTDRLLDLCEYNAPQIAEGWYRDVSRNAKTPSYHALQKDDCVREAIAIYKNLKTLFFAVESFRQIQSVFGRYADLMYQKSILFPRSFML
jgi:hypothetical protein